VGTPSGVLIFVMRIDGDSTDAISGVTYGGVSVTAVDGGLAIDAAGEDGLCKAFFLGTGVPTGAQTVQVTTSVGTYWAGASTVTSVGDTAPAGVVLLQGDGTLAEQSVNDGSPGSPSMRYSGGFSGLQSPPTVGSNSTSLMSEDDGAVCALICRETTAGTGSRSVGFSSATTDDRAFVHLAIYEIP
jgi:hypothetical protein